MILIEHILKTKVVMNVLHLGCVWPPRWSPPVLWRRFKDGLASICVLIHLSKTPRESETTGLIKIIKLVLRSFDSLFPQTT